MAEFVRGVGWARESPARSVAGHVAWRELREAAWRELREAARRELREAA